MTYLLIHLSAKLTEPMYIRRQVLSEKLVTCFQSITGLSFSRNISGGDTSFAHKSTSSKFMKLRSKYFITIMV